MKNMIRCLLITALAIALVTVSGFRADANHGNALHNATEKNDGAWYGSRATIAWTNPNLRNGQWVYHRTSVNNNSSGCFKYTEIGWFKHQQGLDGLIVWDSGCSRHDQFFGLNPAEHTFRQRYKNVGGVDKYSWFMDGALLGEGQTNFSAGTMVTCGGEVATGVEAMGNTRCGVNQKLKKNANGTYTFVAWGGHANYVDNPPYTNVNDPADPNNSFFSTGNE